MEIIRIIQLRTRLEKALLTYLSGTGKLFNTRKDIQFINPKADVYVDGSRQLIFMETPAINKDSIKIDISDDNLLFSAEKNISRNNDRKYFRIERNVGTFFKSIPLAFENHNTLKISHTYRLGVVKIEIEYDGGK